MTARDTGTGFVLEQTEVKIVKFEDFIAIANQGRL